jgi:CheY-like chemotaxis protein
MSVILIVEDEPFICEVAQLIIEDMGHSTLLSSEAADALRVLRSSEPIDALFTDIRLEGATLGGYELAHHATKLRPQLRVLYTSGSDATDKSKALFVKGARFVQKPYAQAELEMAINDLLAAPDAQARSAPSP